MTARRGGISLWRIIHLFFLARAASRGPDALARYAVRRAARQIVYEATRPPRRRRNRRH